MGAIQFKLLEFKWLYMVSMASQARKGHHITSIHIQKHR